MKSLEASAAASWQDDTPFKRDWTHYLFFAVAAATVVAAPWMLGGETVRTQWILLGGGALTLCTGAAVHWRLEKSERDSALWKAMRWPVLLGFLFLGLLGLQALNPSHQVMLEGNLWRLVPLSPVTWAPKSLEAPFDAVRNDVLPYRNTARFLLIFGGAWMYATGLALGLKGTRFARQFAKVLALNAAVLAIICIAHVWSGSQRTLWVYHGTFDFSHSPVFFYKNHNGSYLAASMAVLLGLATTANSRGGRWVCEGTGFLIWVATVLVNSRIATAAATLLGLIYVGWILRKRADGLRGVRRFRSVLIVLVVAGITLFTLRDQTALKRFAPLFAHPIDFLQGGEFRSHLRQVGYEMWSERTAFGWGGGAFLYLFNSYHSRVPELGETIYRQQPNLHRFYWPTANCDWIEFAVEYGAFGFVLLAGIAICPAISWWSRRSREDGLSFFLMIGAVLLLAHGFFDYVLRNPAIMFLFVTLQTLAVALAVGGSRAGLSAKGLASED